MKKLSGRTPGFSSVSLFRLFFLILSVCSGCSQTSETSIGGLPGSADMQILNRTLIAAAQSYESVTRVEEHRVPPAYLKEAHCLVVLPGMLKAAFFAGANHGYGVATCRVEDSWSEPAFLSVTGGSLGLQIGAEQSDVLLLMMDAKSRQSLLTSQMTLGVDVGISAGPTGEKVKGKTDTELSGILAYARSKGAFAGVSLEGAVLSPDATSNQVFYGRDTTAHAILRRAPDEQSSSEVRQFLSELPE